MSAAQQPALSRPAQAVAILRSLPGLAERLRTSPPPSIEEMQDLVTRLEELHPLIKDGTAAPALLSNAAARAALLIVLAVTLRQPLVGSVCAQGSEAGRNNPARTIQLVSYNCVAHCTSICCAALLLCELPPLLAERQLDFALRLMRTQPLQCCARKLAEMGPELLSLQRGEGGPQQDLQHGERGAQEGRAASSGAARAHVLQHKVLVIVDEAGDMLWQSLHCVEALTLAMPLDGDGDAPPPNSEMWQLSNGLVAELRDCCVLEHVARTMLLLLLPMQWLQGGDGNILDYAATLVRIVSRILRVASDGVPMDDAVPSATSVPSTIAAELHGLLSGRCARHAVLVLGVAALCAADGGPSYGLPSELLRHVPIIGLPEGPDGDAVDLRHANGRVVMDSGAVANLVHVLRCGVQGAQPGGQGALSLMLRVGRLVVVSGQAHIGASGGSAEAEAAAQHECGGSGSGGGGGGSGSGSGSSSSRSGGSGGSGGGRRQEQIMVRHQLPRPPATPGRQLLLDEDSLGPLFDDALTGVMELCFPARPGDRPARVAARAECWRLFAAYTRDVLPLEDADELPCSPVHHLQDTGTMLPGAPLPASPPLSWADALAGGWLPCLERLLRRGGEDPGGPESRLALNSLALSVPDVKPCTLTWRHFAVLLAYGEPRQAAGLVATLGKLLHAADLSALVEPAMEDDCIAATAALWALRGAIEEWEAASGAAASEASTAALPAQSAAGRQLALMMSCAACEWLPPLARLAMQAMQLRSAPAAAGESQDDAVRTSVPLLLPLLSWLPVLAQRCTFVAGGEAAAVGGVAAAVGGAGGAGPAGPGGRRSHGPSEGGWPQLLLEEVGAVPLLGAALHMLPSADAAAAAITLAWHVRRRLVRACLAIAVACPREVRATVARASTGQRLVASARTAGGATPTRRGRGPQPAAAAPAIGPAPVPQPQFPWRPQQLRALGAGMRAEGWDAEADGANALAALLQSWEAGGDVGVSEGGLSQDGGEAEAGAEAGTKWDVAAAPQELLAAWQRVEECSALFKNERQVASALVPVSEARGVLRTCSYSG
ncbi:hypothetical protein TSOC_004071 [Tetrabaena socialis]|uniref:Uncharacterized protein n=1 Tax=Tetrabaena socialis TaxID=47790 RepID=A0A2J8A9Y0_9CHLO|nr:hypothetical protein TSOC_004071 [Tetrabaena socialis]|eukprot:PNH09337.1 hypothetical protein TSOC_004071 [Tetrabaena socialis]